MRYISLLALSAAFAGAISPRSPQAQIVSPSNNSANLLPVATSARFLLNGTELPDLPVISLAPLGPYAAITKADFVNVDVPGLLVNVNIDNANDVQADQFAYMSCDPEAYPGHLNASDVLATLLYSDNPNIIIILYSEHSNHCTVTDLNAAPETNGVLTTVNPMAAAALARLGLNANSNGTANILPDLNSFTNGTGDNGFGSDSNLLGPSPTTAVAMIILYSITGIITALFIIIIITGAIRAHRHPERYGPRIIAGRMRQSRAKGIARAMLETLPIVKFGDHEDLPPKPADGAASSDSARDIEMHPTTGTDATAHDASTTTPTTEKAAATAAATTTTVTPNPPTTSPSDEDKTAAAAPHDGTTDDGTLGCSICTEDFTRGEEVRVLPCNHKFHPDCVDPWLLNVSGTCPLCRIDLRPEDERADDAAADVLPGVAAGGEGSLNLPPPLALLGTGGGGAGPGAQGRRATMVGLVGMAYGTREEGIDALRRYRQERRSGAIPAANAAAAGVAPEVQAAERRGLSARLRERLRVRTTNVSEGLERLQRAI